VGHGDIHVPLIEKGIIKEPVEALNCYECDWIEEKSWWFKKVFTVEESLLEQDIIELTLESLDVEADIFLNGLHLAHHRSAFYPYTVNIGNIVKTEDNVLLVRVTSGLEHVNEQDIAAIKKCVSTETDGDRGDRGDKRRVYVRKPQYVYGWDWGPRVATCGIMKSVYIKAYKKVAIRGVHIITQIVTRDKAQLDIKLEVENLHVFKSFEGSVKVDLLFNGESTVTASEIEH